MQTSGGSCKGASIIARQAAARSRAKQVEPEPEKIFEILKPLVHCLGDLFGSACEVVLHDLRRPESSIVDIANGHVTGRRVGGPIVGGPLDDQALAWLHQPGDPTQVHMYATRTADGRRLKSATILYRDAAGQPLAALCINYDISVPLVMERFLRGLIDLHPSEAGPAGPGPAQPGPETQDPVDVEAMITELIDSCVAEVGVAPEQMSKQQRFQVVKALDERGVFLMRGIVQRVARALGVSKFTIYNYLEEVRNS